MIAQVQLKCSSCSGEFKHEISIQKYKGLNSKAITLKCQCPNCYDGQTPTFSNTVKCPNCGKKLNIGVSLHIDT